MGFKVKKPSHLNTNDTVALIAPSFTFDKNLFAKGIEYFKKTQGVKTEFSKARNEPHLFFSSNSTHRTNELTSFFASPKIKGLVGIRGGYGCAEIYSDVLKFLKKKKCKPKIFLGFSDLTLFLNGLYQDLGWVTFHGPMIVGRPFREPKPFESWSLKTCLFSKRPLGLISTAEMKTLNPGTARAPIMGGCLTVLASTLGTPYEINTDGKILFLEDIGEAPYRLHRMVHQLEQAGKFKKIKGVIIGGLTDCKPHSEIYKNISALDALGDALLNAIPSKKIPIIYGFPAGHGAHQLTFPIGVQTEITAQKNRKPTVDFLEAGTV